MDAYGSGGEIVTGRCSSGHHEWGRALIPRRGAQMSYTLLREFYWSGLFRILRGISITGTTCLR